jgi:hypothetical protein
MTVLVGGRYVSEAVGIMGAAFAKGNLADGTPLVVDMAGAALPGIVVLGSVAAGHKIEVSYLDGEADEWHEPPPDVVTDDFKAVFITTSCSFVRFTGANGVKWSVR